MSSAAAQTPRVFPKPFLICIGVAKGGTCKSWLALNLASRLGFLGYDVVALDMNQKHDLARDHRKLMAQGIYPRFDVVEHTPFVRSASAHRFMQAPPPNLSPHQGRDFIVIDTCQFVEFESTYWSWANCHLMLMPVTPTTMDRENFDDSLKLYRAMPGKRPPLAVVPSRVRVLKNSTPQRQFEDLLLYFESQGCVVPDFTSEYQIPESELMMAQNTRWVFNEVDVNDRRKALPPDFVVRVDITLQWICRLIREHYGAMPAPCLPELKYFDRKSVLEQLRYECGLKMPQQTLATA
jgi:hypothetical protein